MKNLMRIFTLMVFVVIPKLFADTSIKDLIGNLDVIFCYSADGAHIRCRNLQNGNDWLVCERDPHTSESWVGSINEDGSKLVFEDGKRNCVINLNGTNKEYVSKNLTTNGTFWRDSLGYDWIVYTGELESRIQAGSVWKVRIDSKTNKPIDSTRTLIVGRQYSCGFSLDGKYLGDVYGGVSLYDINKKIEISIASDTMNFMGSMHFGNKRWLMYNHGKLHDTLFISEWNFTSNTVRKIWQYAQDSTEIFALWSSTNDSFAIAEKDSGYVYLIKLSVDTTGTTDNKGSHLEAFTGLSVKLIGDTSDTSTKPDSVITSVLVGRPWVGSLPRRAATPIISPCGGWYIDSVLVSVRTITGNTNIHFTVDGTEPLKSSPLYTDSFYISLNGNDSIVLKTRTFSDSLDSSEVYSVVFHKLPINTAVADTQSLINGLDYSYYKGYYLFLSDIEKSAPNFFGNVNNFDISVADRDDEFAIKYEGYILIPQTGKYNFYTWSDDSTRLFIDSQLIVANNHQWEEQVGFIGLAKGFHKISVIYQQGDGGRDLSIKCEGPDFKKGNIPDSLLFRKLLPIKLQSPHGAESYVAGVDSLAISFTVDTTAVDSVKIEFSLDSCITWNLISKQKIIQTNNTCLWYVPLLLDSVSTLTDNCFIRISSLSNLSVTSQSKKPIKIVERVAIKNKVIRKNLFFDILKRSNYLILKVPSGVISKVTFCSLDGTIIKKVNLTDNWAYRINTQNLPKGIYIINVKTNNRIYSNKILITR